MDTIFSKKGNNRTTSSRLSASSEENMVDRNTNTGSEPEASGAGDSSGIVVTTEVAVTYEASDKPFAHAAMVGLVSGNVARASSIRR